jgi:protein-S-isoprenylcysteine O-methyltransferase Ste14
VETLPWKRGRATSIHAPLTHPFRRRTLAGIVALTTEDGCRIVLAVILLGTAAVGIPHRLRADRAGGHVSRRADPSWFWLGMSLAGPPLALTCSAFLIQPRWVDFASVDTPGWSRWLGAPVAMSGVVLFGWMFRHLGLNVTSTSMPRAAATLVSTGPYRWIRHPMYSATSILVIAVSLLTANLVVAAAGIIMFGLLVARSRIEEQRLAEKFGSAYRDYQRRTGRFVPRLFP